MPDWEALYAADVRATPFLSPGWGRAWMRHWAPDARPWLLRARDGRQVRRLEGGIGLREVHEEHELPAVIDRWQELRTRQWRALGKQLTPEHASKRFRDFMFAVVRNLLPSGQALVWEFRHHGEVIG